MVEQKCLPGAFVYSLPAGARVNNLKHRAQLC